MVDESIVVEVKDSVDTSIAVKIKAIATEARSAFKDLGTLQDKLSALGVSKLGSISRELDGGATATAKLATAQANLATAQQKTVTATATATSALSKLQKAQDEAALSTLRLQQAQNKLASTKPVVSDGQKFVQSLEAQAAAIGKTQSELLAMKAAQLGVTAQAAPFIDALKKQTVEFDKNGLSAKQYSAAMRGVPAQITDIVVSLQGGQAPMTVLLQQGGQLKDIFGGIGAAAKALGRGLLGLINPYTLVAGAIGAIVLAYNQATGETDNFRKSLVLSGNAIGSNVGELQNMAESIGKTTGTIGGAADALALMAGSSKVARVDLEKFTESTIRFEKYAGVAIADSAKAFAELANDPVKASEKLNKEMNYLTASVYEQIVALTEQGDKTGAVALAQSEYSSAHSRMSSEIESNLGRLEQAWKNAGSVAKSAWDQFLGLFRADSIESTIGKLEKQLAALQSSPSITNGNWEQRTQDELNYWKHIKSSQDDYSANQKRMGEQTTAQIALDSAWGLSLSKVEKAQMSIAKLSGEMGKTDQTPENIAKYAAAIQNILKGAQEAPKHVKALTNEYEGVYSAIRQATAAANEELDSNEKLTASDRFRISVLEQVDKAYRDTLKSKSKSASAALEEYKAAKSSVLATEALISAKEQQQKIQKEAFKADQDGYKAMHDLQKQAEYDYKSITKASEEYLASAKEQADTVNSESNLYALNTEQRKLAIEQYKIEAEWKTKIAEIDARTNLDKGQKDLAKETVTSAMIIKMNTATRKSVQDGWLQTADTIRDGLTDAFMEAINGTKSLWVALRDAVVGMFSNMVLRPIVQAVVGSAVGGAANAVAGQVGGSAASSVFTSGIASAVTTGISSFTAGWAAAGYEAAMGAAFVGPSVAGAGGVMGAGASAYGALGAVPVAGWIALAVVAAYAIFHKEYISAEDAGRAQIAYNSDGTPKGPAYNTTGNAAQIATATTATNALAKSYFDTAKKLGAEAIAGAFEVGYNTGQEGANPMAVFGVNIGTASYSSGEVSATDPAAMQLAASRAVLTALQQSELPTYMAGIFDDITASTATQEQITAAINGAVALKSFHDQLQSMPWENLKNLSYDASKALATAAGGLGNLESGLGTFFDKFYSTAEKNTAATAALSAGFENLGVTMPAINESTRAWYKTLVETAMAADLSVAKNAEYLTGLLALAPAVDGVTAAQEALKKTNQSLQDQIDVLTGKATEREQILSRIEDASTRDLQQRLWDLQDLRDAEKKANDERIAAAEKYANALADAQSFLDGALKNISQYLDGLNATPTGLLSPQEQLTNAAAQFNEQLAKAKSGDRDAMSGITQYADQYINAAKAFSASGGSTQSIIAMVKDALGALPDQVSAEQFIVDAINGTTDAVDALNSKIVIELSIAAKSEIEKLIRYVTDTDLLPDDLKQLALATSSTLQKTIDFVLGIALPEDLKTLALSTVSKLTKTVSYVVGSTLPDDLKKIAFDEVGLLTKTIELVSGSTISGDLKILALNNVGTLSKTIQLIAGSSVTDEMKKLALDTVGVLNKTITLATSTLTNPQDLRLALLSNEAVTKSISAALASGNATALQLALEQSNTIYKTIQASGGTLTEDQRLLLEAITGTANATLTVNGSLVFDRNDPIRSIFEAIQNNTMSTTSALGYPNNSFISYLDNIQRGIKSIGQHGMPESYSGWYAGYAHGGAFTNGIVNTPTYFNNSVMGEAGPEAIMPLSRTSSGDLGVQVQMPDYNPNARDMLLRMQSPQDNNAVLAAEVRRLNDKLTQIESNTRQDGNIKLTIVTPDGKKLTEQTINQIKERSRRGELVIHADGVK